MPSPAIALASLTWWRHRRGLAAVLALCIAAVFVFQLMSAETLDEKNGGMLISVQFIMALAYVAAVFAYGFDCSLESAESGFPTRLFALPVRTRVLAGWPMLQGMAVAALLWSGWAYIVLRPAGFEVSPGFVALQAAAFVATLQAILWWPFGLPWARVIVALLALPTILFGPAIGRIYEVREAWFIVLLSALIPSAYVVAVTGISRARRGDNPRWRLHSRSRQAANLVDKRPLRSFRSPACALIWYEKRRHLLMYPLIVGCCAASLTALHLAFMDASSAVPLFLNFPFTACLMAPIAGAFLGRSGIALGNPHPLGAFAATRPVTTAALAAAKLKTAVAATLVGWAVMLAFAAICFFDMGLQRNAARFLDRARSEGFLARARAIVVLFVVVSPLFTWRLMIDSLCASLTGRVWISRFNLLLYGLALPFGTMLTASYSTDPARYAFIVDNSAWWLGSAVAVKLLAATWVVRANDRRGLVERRALARLLCLWVAVAAALFVVAWEALSQEKVPALTVAFGIILLLPLVRLFATPLAVNWDRHR